jgi:2-hydroxy-6-oxonona-2,4-dienedioate hydrolase
MNSPQDSGAGLAESGGRAASGQAVGQVDAFYRFASLPSGKLAYVEAGSGPAVVLIHGSYGSFTHWNANIDSIAKRNRVIAVDLPGFGRSFAVPQNSELEVFARAVIELAVDLRLERFALGGFSFGGLVCAEILRLAPQLIGSLFLISPPLPGAVNPAVLKIQQEIGTLALRKTLRDSVVATLEKLFLFNAERITEDAISITATNIQATQFRARPLISRCNLVDALTPLRARVPMCFAIGEKDPFQLHATDELRRSLTEVAGQSRTKWIARAAHWACYDRPAETNSIITEFLSEVS